MATGNCHGCLLPNLSLGIGWEVKNAKGRKAWWGLLGKSCSPGVCRERSWPMWNLKRKRYLDVPGDAMRIWIAANAGTMGSVLVWADSICHWATKPVPQLLKPECRACSLQSKRSHHNGNLHTTRRAALHLPTRKPTHSQKTQCNKTQRKKNSKKNRVFNSNNFLIQLLPLKISEHFPFNIFRKT